MRFYLIFHFARSDILWNYSTGTSEPAYVTDSDIDAAKIAAMKAAELGLLIFNVLLKRVFSIGYHVIGSSMNVFADLGRISLYRICIFIFFPVLAGNKVLQVKMWPDFFLASRSCPYLLYSILS